MQAVASEAGTKDIARTQRRLAAALASYFDRHERDPAPGYAVKETPLSATCGGL